MRFVVCRVDDTKVARNMAVVSNASDCGNVEKTLIRKILFLYGGGQIDVIHAIGCALTDEIPNEK